MKAITIRQPWVSLIAEGVKTIETRGREHPWRSAIGQTIAIHAAVRKPETARLGDWWCERTWGDEFGLLDESGHPRRLPLGAVVATCRLVDVIPMTESWGQTECLTLVSYTDGRPDDLAVRRGNDGKQIEWVNDQQPYGDFAVGRWALLLADVRKCAPVPCRGYQGFWTLPASVADNLMGWAA